MRKPFGLLRRAFWNSFEHGAFGVAKGAAYSAILSFFPLLLMIASTLIASGRAEEFLQQIAYGLGKVLPPGSRTTIRLYMEGVRPRPIGTLVVTGLLTLHTASGIMLTLMQGFRNAYQAKNTWGFWAERGRGIFLVLLAFLPMTFASIMVAFGTWFENYLIFHSAQIFSPYILLMFTVGRWALAMLTSIAVLALVYHWGLPRVQPIHRVLPGAVLATLMWFAATVAFGWYVTNVAQYNALYGPLSTAIVLLVWMYMVSFIVVVGAEFNALMFPRETGQNGTAQAASK